MKLGRRKSRKKARIEIIPLIDIMFFLLATFVLVSFSMVENRGLMVKLPETKSTDSGASKKNQDGKNVSVSILNDGSISVNKITVSIKELEKKLLELAGSTPEDVRIQILADKGSPLEKTVDVMDVARSSQINQILLRTRTK